MALDVLDVDFSGSTDGAGNLTVSKVPSPAYWCTLKVVAQVAGSPVWVIAVNQRPVTFGRGPRVDLGPMLLQPKDQVSIQVSGAQASSSLTGKLLGVTGQLQEVIASFQPSPNTIAVDTLSPIQQIDRFDSSAIAIKTYQVQPGMASFGFGIDINEFPFGITDPAHAVLPTQVTLTGLPSGETYVSLQAPSQVIRRQAYWGPINPGDTQVTLTTAGVVANGCFLDVLMSPLVMTGQGGDQNGNAAVSMQGAQPAPWQAGTTRAVISAVSVASGGIKGIIAGVAGVTIYPGVFSLFQDGANAAGRWVLEDSLANPVHDMQCNATRGLLDRGTLEGIPLVGGAGAGLQIVNQGAAASFISGYVDYQFH